MRPAVDFEHERLCFEILGKLVKKRRFEFGIGELKNSVFEKEIFRFFLVDISE